MLGQKPKYNFIRFLVGAYLILPSKLIQNVLHLVSSPFQESNSLLDYNSPTFYFHSVMRRFLGYGRPLKPKIRFKNPIFPFVNLIIFDLKYFDLLNLKFF